METITDAVVLLMFGAFIYKLVDMLRHARAGDWDTVRTQAFAWALGVVLIFVLSVSELGSRIRLGAGYVYGLNTVSKVLLGLALASTMSILHDVVAGNRRWAISDEPNRHHLSLKGSDNGVEQ